MPSWFFSLSSFSCSLLTHKGASSSFVVLGSGSSPDLATTVRGTRVLPVLLLGAYRLTLLVPAASSPGDRPARTKDPLFPTPTTPLLARCATMVIILASFGFAKHAHLPPRSSWSIQNNSPGKSIQFPGFPPSSNPNTGRSQPRQQSGRGGVMGDAVAVGNGLGSSGDWSGPTDLAQDHDRGLGLGPKNQEDSVSIDPHGCALCALALVYCHQNALCVQHLAVEEDLRAGEMCEKCDEIIGSLPRGQAAALSLGLPLPTEAVDGLCDFLVQGVSKRSTPIHHQGSSFEDLKRGLRDALMSHPDEAEELCGALDFFLNSLETPDDLVMFFARAHDLAGGGAGQGGGVVEPNSMLGVYLRERCAAFELLSFEGVGRLLRRCESFRAGEVAESATAGGAGGKGAGARSEPALLDRFLRDAKRRDYYSALSSLHAYFDCSAGRHPGLRGGDHRLGNFEHATLEMAQVHVQFGQYGEAAKALEETLRSSQQNTNHVCLAHSLALMCRVLSSPEYRFESCTRPKRGRDAGHNHCVGDANARRLRDLLRHCLRRSRDLRLPHLECFALVEMARIALEEGDATKTVDAVADLVGRIAHVVGNESAETDAGDAALEDLGLEPCPRLSLYPAAAGGSEMLRAGAGSARGLVEELAASLELLRVARWQDKGCR